MRKIKARMASRIISIMLSIIIMMSGCITAKGEALPLTSVLDLTLADIQVALYNAVGVSIGDPEILTAIREAYGQYTISDLIDLEVIIGQNPEYTKEQLKALVGYGSTVAPMLKVSQNKLKTLIGTAFVGAASLSLASLFAFGNEYADGVIDGFGMVLGQVANTGKIFATQSVKYLNDIINNAQQTIQEIPLYHILRNFINGAYFTDLIENSTIGAGSRYPYNGGIYNINTGEGKTIVPPNGIYYRFNETCCVSLEYDAGTRRGYAVIFDGSKLACGKWTQSDGYYTVWLIPKNGTAVEGYAYRTFYYDIINVDNKEFLVSQLGTSLTIDANGTQILSGNNATDQLSGYYSEQPFTTINEWKRSVINEWYGNTESTGITSYVNGEVGNITGDNKADTQPNINGNEELIVGTIAQYQPIINNIVNNTDNGLYEDNAKVINNYITNNIYETSPDTGRPEPEPIPEEINPGQPFLSPAPTPIPEYEQDAGNMRLPENIKEKFPFCLPFDLKAVIDKLWTPTAQAPHITWEANFGSIGRLGTVDVDLTMYDDQAVIMRRLELILYIVGLVLITRNIIGG